MPDSWTIYIIYTNTIKQNVQFQRGGFTLKYLNSIKFEINGQDIYEPSAEGGGGGLVCYFMCTAEICFFRLA